MSLVGHRITFKMDNSTYEGDVIDKFRNDNREGYPGYTKYLVVLDNDAVMTVSPNIIIKVGNYNS